jgi:hypothetical protein
MIEPSGKLRGLIGRFGNLDQAQWVSRSQAEPIGAESKGTENHLLRLLLTISYDCRPLRHRARSSAQVDLVADPFRTLVG